VGDVVGNIEGKKVGTSVGDVVGLFEGLYEGCVEGDVVGPSEGKKVGISVGKSVTIIFKEGVKDTSLLLLIFTTNIGEFSTFTTAIFFNKSRFKPFNKTFK
jgi:hypothetical protein